MSTVDDAHVVRVLGLISREFARVREHLIVSEEPGPDEVTGAATEPVPASVGVDGEERKGVLGRLGAAARFALTTVTGRVHPRHDDWAGAELDDRVDWWVGRFGTAVAALTALPSLGGRLASSSGVVNAVGASGQLLVIYAVAHEAGVSDRAEQVSTAARIVLGREIDVHAVRRLLGEDPEVAGDPTPQADRSWDDSELAEAAAELDDTDPEQSRGILGRLGGAARLVWRTARQLRGLDSELSSRPQGGFLVRTLRQLPAVGVAGGFLSERRGLAVAAERAQEAFGG